MAPYFPPGLTLFLVLSFKMFTCILGLKKQKKKKAWVYLVLEFLPSDGRKNIRIGMRYRKKFTLAL